VPSAGNDSAKAGPRRGFRVDMHGLRIEGSGERQRLGFRDFDGACGVALSYAQVFKITVHEFEIITSAGPEGA
jgi:hypothetical protein